uniref:Ras-associating domain-containing protein n=1 Tax=Ascaris lumbricoides TaxID=6252 RepID=A0A0M3HZX7_ASCLU
MEKKEEDHRRTNGSSSGYRKRLMRRVNEETHIQEPAPRLRLGELNAEKFECLIFVCGFQSPADTEYRLRLLKSTDKDANAMLEDLILEYRRLNNVNLDNKDDSPADAVLISYSATSMLGQSPAIQVTLVDLPVVQQPAEPQQNVDYQPPAQAPVDVHC